MNYYVTIVSGKYALRAQTLYQSLVENVSNAVLIVFCIDPYAYKILKVFKNDSMILRSPEDYDSELIQDLKRTRSESEFCWTLKPFSVINTMNEMKDAEWVTYLDTDMMVFDDLSKVTDECTEYDIILTPHNESHPFFSYHVEVGGKYNAGYVAFKNTEKSMLVLNDWKEKCFQYMTSVPTNGFFADQKYLEDFDEYGWVYSSSIPGLNQGPWNIIGKKVETINGNVFIGGDKLILYHMQGFRSVSSVLFDIYSDHLKINKDIYYGIYLPYILLIKKVWKKYNSFNLQCKIDNDVLGFDLYFIVRETIKVIKRRSNVKFVI